MKRWFKLDKYTEVAIKFASGNDIKMQLYETDLLNRLIPLFRKRTVGSFYYNGKRYILNFNNVDMITVQRKTELGGEL